MPDKIIPPPAADSPGLSGQFEIDVNRAPAKRFTASYMFDQSESKATLEVSPALEAAALVLLSAISGAAALPEDLMAATISYDAMAGMVFLHIDAPTAQVTARLFGSSVSPQMIAAAQAMFQQAIDDGLPFVMGF